VSPDVHVNLTAENLEYISDRIGEQFETKLTAMVSNVVKAILPEIIPELAKQVNSHLADRLKSLEATNTAKSSGEVSCRFDLVTLIGVDVELMSPTFCREV